MKKIQIHITGRFISCHYYFYRGTWLEGFFIAYKWHGHFRVPRIVFGRQVEQTASGRGGKSYRTPEILFLIHCTVFRFSHLCPGWVYTKSFEVMCKIQKWTGKKYEISDQFGPGPNKSFKTRTNSEGVFQILGPDRTKTIRFEKTRMNSVCWSLPSYCRFLYF